MAAVAQIISSKGFGLDVQGWVSDLYTKVARYRLYRKTLSELSFLSGRELADLGMSRSMIKRAALEAAYGDI